MSLCNFKIYIFGYSFVKLCSSLLKKGSQNCHQVYYSEAGYMVVEKHCFFVSLLWFLLFNLIAETFWGIASIECYTRQQLL